MKKHLIADPKERNRRAKEKVEWVLDFLRDEIYSSTEILADVMAVEARAARTTLNKMVRDGFLVKDEIKFMGARALPLWGITMTGLMHNVEPSLIATMKLKHHTPGRISPRTIEHTLDIQRCRQYLELEKDYDEWRPTRLLPAQNEKKNHPDRWPVYPDGVVGMPGNDGLIPVAIEVERTRKTPQRYVQLIRGHLVNLKRKRYARVFYYCTTEKNARSLEALFLRLIKERNISFSVGDDKWPIEKILRLFVFDTIEKF